MSHKSHNSRLSPIGFGAFKIGRNEGVKYPQPYELPDEDSVCRLLNGVLDTGCNLIDTAPAYGLSEERIGKSISHRRAEYRLSTKVGETFENSCSTYNFSTEAIRSSLERSLKRLKTEYLDYVFIHSNGDDLRILNETDTVKTLIELKSKGLIQKIGLSGKTVEGAALALGWADAIMVEFNLDNQSHRGVIEQAHSQRIDVFIKKGLGSGHLPPEESIRFALSHPGVTSLIVGGLNLDHFQSNWMVAMDLVSSRR